MTIHTASHATVVLLVELTCVIDWCSGTISAICEKVILNSSWDCFNSQVFTREKNRFIRTWNEWIHEFIQMFYTRTSLSVYAKERELNSEHVHYPLPIIQQQNTWISGPNKCMQYLAMCLSVVPLYVLSITIMKIKKNGNIFPGRKAINKGI